MHSLYVNDERNIKVESFDQGETVEVATRDTPGGVWGPPVTCKAEVRDTDGRRTWEPGSLGTLELQQLLMDVLADLWSDSYRREQHQNARLRLFRRAVESALYCATGGELWLSTKREGR